jgi:hypothetical protein
MGGFMTLRHALLATTRALTLAMSLSVSVQAQAQAVSVTDDRGHTVSLPRPAQRVVSLTPHGTELVFAVGGGSRLVGVVEFSDYPEAAQRIRRVGDNKAVDLEAVAALKPDLIVVWRHGNARRQLEKLGNLGIPVYESDPRRLDDIPGALERLGRLLGTDTEAAQAAARYRQELQTLRERYAGRPPVTTFYQVWRQPLKTLNNDHPGAPGAHPVRRSPSASQPRIHVRRQHGRHQLQPPGGQPRRLEALPAPHRRAARQPLLRERRPHQPAHAKGAGRGSFVVRGDGGGAGAALICGLGSIACLW